MFANHLTHVATKDYNLDHVAFVKRGQMEEGETCFHLFSEGHATYPRGFLGAVDEATWLVAIRDRAPRPLYASGAAD